MASCIPEKKLTTDYFDRLTCSIGKSERLRTLRIGKTKYLHRLLKEVVKWAGTLVLFARHLLLGQPEKGKKLIRFRYNVTRGLLAPETKPNQ